MKANNMYWKSRTLIMILLVLLSAGAEKVFSQEPGSGDKSHSPYFFINSEDSSTDRMPLKATSADVNIAGVIADVVVKQRYENTGKNTLEAVYVFPASTRAAVYAMKMKIGEREIIAVIQEKESARQQYEQAKQQGKTASLLEQERPNVFSMNVANILPGDIIEVELKYTELLVPESGIYEFVYPTVVGPRYNSPGENHSVENWIANPYLEEGEAPNYSFDINVKLNAGLPIQSLYSKSHDLNFEYRGKKKAEISLKSSKVFQGDRDYILQYRLAGKSIESGLLLFEGEKENFFLAMIQPPKQVSPTDIPPREYIFIVDVSGSMHGFPLDVSKKLMKDLLKGMKPADRFNILLFAGDSRVYSQESQEASETNISAAVKFLDQQRGGGGTELLPALKKGMAMGSGEGISRSFVIITDGYVSVERQAFEYINKNLGNANFFPFGIGSSVNRNLIEGMAHVGRGEAFVLTSQKDAETVAGKFREYISQPVLTNIELEFNGFYAYDIEPASVPDVLAERPVIVYGKWKGQASGSIELNGFSGDRKYRQVLEVKDSRPEKSNSALKYLWARERIRLLDDFASVSYGDKELEKEVTALGLEYNLLTRFTSFLALDSEIRNASGNSTTVKQPLPLPQGVSNYALSGSVSGVQSRMMIRGFASRKAAKGQAAKGVVYEVVDDMDFEEEPGVAEPEFQEITKPAEFKDGEEALIKFLSDNIMKPKGRKGVVFVQFTIDADGSVKDIKIVGPADKEMDQRVIDAIKLTDKMWIPAMSGETPVESRIILPVKF